MDIKHLTFFITDRCSAACPICCFQCSPKNSFVADKEMIRRYMREAKELGTVQVFGFTGGEPLLYPELVLELGRYGKEECGIPFSVVSNGFWGKDPQYAFELAKKLVDAGMKGIRISADIWHQQFVPVQSVKNALRAVFEAGIAPDLSIMETKDRRVITETIEALRPELYLAKDVTYYPLVLPEAAVYREKEHGLSDGDILHTFSGKDAACEGMNMIVFFTDGRIYPCCSQFSFEIPRICLGKAGEMSLTEIQNRINRDPVLEMMQRGNLQWFVKEAAAEGICLKDSYSMDCEICRDLLNDPDFLEYIERRAKEETQRQRVAKFLGICGSGENSKGEQ